MADSEERPEERTPEMVTAQERAWLEELRTVQAANPDSPVQMLTMAVAPDLAAFVAGVVEMAIEAEDQDYAGSLAGLVLKSAKDPNRRRGQYLFALQFVEQAYGPREGEEFQIYFDPKRMQS
jgi:hypothetical protein